MKAFSLENSTALVTGSSQGIGLAIALGMREAGAQVVLHGLGERAAAVPADAAYLLCDLTEKDAAPELIGQTVAVAPKLNALVCNAGSFFDVPFLEMTPDLWAKTIQLNLRATFFLVQAFANQLIARGEAGSVVIVSSTNGMQAEPGSVAYDTSKGGLISMTRSLAVSLAPHRIRVNGIAPGLIRTPLTERWMETRARDLLPHYEKNIPLGRVGSPEDCAGAAVFLCSGAASYLTGEIIVIDGGLTVQQIGPL
jgi:NAD(P)-dependent dehydrogenase (short-subunit alcohol dehydrogenase family)